MFSKKKHRDETKQVMRENKCNKNWYK